MNYSAFKFITTKQVKGERQEFCTSDSISFDYGVLTNLLHYITLLRVGFFFCNGLKLTTRLTRRLVNLVVNFNHAKKDRPQVTNDIIACRFSSMLANCQQPRVRRCAAVQNSLPGEVHLLLLFFGCLLKPPQGLCSADRSSGHLTEYRNWATLKFL